MPMEVALPLKTNVSLTCLLLETATGNQVAYRKMIVYEWGVRLNSFMTGLSDKSVRQSIISQTGLVCYHAID